MSAYPALLRLLTRVAIQPAVGARYLTIADGLPDFYAWPEERRAAWRDERLRAIVDHARRRVPFYRDLLGDRGQPALSDLPVVDKARIRAAMDAFSTEGWRSLPHVPKATGGTTGDPWRYPLDKRAWEQMYAAALHFYALIGYRYGERMVLLGAPASLGLDDQGLRARLRHALERHDTSLAGYAIDPAASRARVAAATRRPAALWYGFAGTIAAMADAAIEAGLPVSGPPAIVTTAEALQPAWRARIAAAFGVAPYDQYGCNDGGVLAQSCRHGRLHLAENVSIVELLDGERTCRPGEEGEVTVTNLHARVLPFLRYRTGDRAVAGEGPCPCGTPGATLERVSGREGDRLRLPDGSELSALSFGRVFMQTEHVRRWQLVQPDTVSVRVRLDVEPGFDDREAELIARAVAERCGDGVKVELTTTEEIERSPGGKQKVVVRGFD